MKTADERRLLAHQVGGLPLDQALNVVSAVVEILRLKYAGPTMPTETWALMNEIEQKCAAAGFAWSAEQQRLARARLPVTTFSLPWSAPPSSCTTPKSSVKSPSS
jgi:hypothetical protein